MAENRKVIIGIDLDAARAVKSAALLESRIVKLTEESRTNRKAISEQNKTVEATAIAAQKATQQLNHAVRVYGANSEEARKLRTEVRALDTRYSDQQKRLNLLSQEQVTYKETVKAARKEQRLLSRDMAAVPGSLNQQRAELIRLKQEYANFSVGVNGTDKELLELTNRIRSLTRDISKQEQKIGVFGRNVGNYANSIRSAFTGAANVLTGGLLVGGITGVTSAIGNLANESIALFDVQAKADAQLRASLESTRGVAGRTFEELKEQATELQGLTLFGDEQIQGAQSLLLTFTNVREEIFDRATPAILDLSAKLNIDLKSASLQVGKALNDPIKGMNSLNRAGIQFTEEQQKTIKTLVALGDTSGAQTVILKELETQFKGSAEAAAQAGTGPIEQLENKISDLKEEIGEQLLPVQEALTRAQLRFFTGLSKGIELAVRFGGTIKAIPGFIKDNREELLALTVAMIAFNAQAIAASLAALRQAAAQNAAAVASRALAVAQAFLNRVMALNPIGLVVTALAALSAAFVFAYKRSEKFRAVVQGTFSALKNVVGNFVDAVKSQVVGIGNVIAGAFTFDLDRLKEGVKQLGEGIKGQFTAIGKGTVEAFQDGYAGEIERSKLERARKAAAEALDLAQPAQYAGTTAGGAFLNGLNEALDGTKIGIPETEEQRNTREKAEEEARQKKDVEIKEEQQILKRRIDLSQEGSLQELELKKELLEKERDLELNAKAVTNLERELIEQQYQARELELQTNFDLAKAETQLEAGQELLDKELAQLEISYQNKEVAEEEYLQRRNELEIQRKQLELVTLEEGSLERLELEAEIAGLSAQYVEDSEERKRKAREETATEAEKKLAAERQLAEARRDIDRNIVDAAETVTRAVVDATEEESAARRAAIIVQRTLAIAGTIIDTEERISAITAASGELVKFLSPIIGPAAIPVAAGLTGAQIGFAVAQGAARVAALSGIQFAEGGAAAKALAQIGGLAVGPSHEGGGIPGIVAGRVPVEFEGGEYIVRQEATARNSDVIEQINQDAGRSRFALVKMFAKGGVIHRPEVRRYETGGVVSQPVAAGLAKEAVSAAEVADIVRATLEGMPAPEVSVTEIANVGRRVAVKEGRAKL